MKITRLGAVWFFVKLVGLYALFAWPWPALEAAYSRGFAATVEWILRVDRSGPPKGVYGTNAIVLLYSKHEADPEHDVQIVLGNVATMGGTDKTRTSSRNLGYVPTVVLAALVLATPVSWKRKLIALAAGLACVHVFIAARFALLLAKAFQGEASYCLFRWQPPWDRALEETYRIVAEVPATTYVVPLIIWLAVTFRREDWESLVSGTGGRPVLAPRTTPVGRTIAVSITQVKIETQEAPRTPPPGKTGGGRRST